MSINGGGIHRRRQAPIVSDARGRPWATIADAMEHIKAGRLRARGQQRVTYAGVAHPATAEFVPGYEAVGWVGVVAPKDISAPIVDVLNTIIKASPVPRSGRASLLGVKPYSPAPRLSLDNSYLLINRNGIR
jgi:hypothetical protein